MRKINPINFKGMPYNYAQVSSFISRSAKPDQYEFIWLKDNGVTDIIDFSREDEDNMFWYSESEIVEQLGIRYHRLPFSAKNPSDTIADNFLKIVDDVKANNGKLHIHCLMGADRTGVMVYIYKMLNNIGNAFDNLQEVMSRGHNDKRYPKLLPWAKKYLQSKLH